MTLRARFSAARAMPPPPLDRRDFLKQAAGAAGLAAAAPLLPGCGDSGLAPLATLTPPAPTPAPGPAAALPSLAQHPVFTHSVTSGDPLPGRVILWTRAVPPPGIDTTVPVSWQAARDEAFTQVVASGRTETSAAKDYTVKVDAPLPAPDTVYFYRFSSQGRNSPTGRTRTAPDALDATLRVVATTCTNPEVSEMNSLRALAQLPTLHAIVHLGDYIYEFGGNPSYEPVNECVTLADYRLRHGCFRAYEANAEAHRLHPWVVVYDDGDISNAAATAEGAAGFHNDNEGSWEARKQAATQAFEEWVPCRIERRYVDGRPVVYRRLQWGPLADLLMLDTRLDGRDKILGDAIQSFDARELDDPNRRLISPEQMDWLTGHLATSQAVWKLVGNQAMLGHWLSASTPQATGAINAFLGLREQGNLLYSDTSWNGYTADRKRLYARLKEANVKNLLVVSGDAHLSFAMDLPEDPLNPLAYDPVTGRGSLGVDFSVPSVNSETFVEQFGYAPRTGSLAVEAASRAANPHHAYTELDSKGYLLLTITQASARAEFWMMDDVTTANTRQTLGCALTCAAGSNHLVLASVNPLAGGGAPA
jgi:alkaline phosphatase D